MTGWNDDAITRYIAYLATPQQEAPIRWSTAAGVAVEERLMRS
jgi:hypothetical protein